MERQNRRKLKSSIIFILIILFFIDGYKFLNSKGNEHPVAATLFEMVIILAAIVFLHHKKEIIEGNKEIIGQTNIEKYFRKEKKE